MTTPTDLRALAEAYMRSLPASVYAALRSAADENEQLRELLNVHNLGGWQDSLTLIKERDALRAENAAQLAEIEKWKVSNALGVEAMREGNEIERKLRSRVEGLEKGWAQEADDLDTVLSMLKLDPQDYRTDGGNLQIGKVRAALAQAGEG